MNSWDIKEKESIHPARRTSVVEVSDVLDDLNKFLVSDTLSDVKLRIHELVDELEENRT